MFKQLDTDTIEEWFTYKNPNDAQIDQMVKVRESAKQLAHVILTEVPDGPDKTAAIRKLRETVMTANLGIMFEIDD